MLAKVLGVTCHFTNFLFFGFFPSFFGLSSSPTSGCVRLQDHKHQPCMIDSLSCAWGRHPVSAQTRSPIATAVVSSLAIPASHTISQPLIRQLSCIGRSTHSQPNIHADFNWLALSSLISGEALSMGRRRCNTSLSSNPATTLKCISQARKVTELRMVLQMGLVYGNR